MRTLTVLVEQCLAEVPGGTGRYTARIAAAMAAAAPNGWTVETASAWHRDITAARVPGVNGPRRLPAGARTLAALWRYGLPPSLRGDSVHATTPLAPRRAGHPLVATVHDLVAFSAPDTLTRHGAAWHRAMIARIARTADAVVVPCQAVADELAGRFPLGDRVRVIPHGVTPIPVPADASARRVRLGLPDGGYVLALGTVEPRKGIDVLVGAIARIKDLHLVLAGPDGWGGLDPAAMAAAAGLPSDRLHRTGRLGDADIAAVLAGAAVVAVPSRAEGFGLPVLEAMAAGVPVVHSRVPALLEVAGGAGLAVRVGDVGGLAAAIEAVTGDRGLARRLSADGRRRAAEFTWEGAAYHTWRVHLSLA